MQGNQQKEEETFYDIWPEPVDLNYDKIQTAKPFSFALKEPLTDPIKHLVTKHFGNIEASKRMMPNSESVTADINGLQILIVNAWIHLFLVMRLSKQMIWIE